MENKNVNVQNTKKETNHEELKVVKLKSLNLDPEQLLIENEELKEIYSKRYNDLTESDIEKIPLFKAKVVKKEQINRYSNSKETNFYAIVMLCNGVTIEKRLDDQDVLSIQNFNPDLFSDGASKVFVPVKLTSFVNNKGNRLFKYLVLLSPGVFMGSTSPENNKSGYDTGYLRGSILNNLIGNNLQYKSNPARQVRFVNTDMSNEEKALSDIVRFMSVEEYDSF